jgi:hypothetical protein
MVPSAHSENDKRHNQDHRRVAGIDIRSELGLVRSWHTHVDITHRVGVIGSQTVAFMQALPVRAGRHDAAARSALRFKGRQSLA